MWVEPSAAKQALLEKKKTKVLILSAISLENIHSVITPNGQKGKLAVSNESTLLVTFFAVQFNPGRIHQRISFPERLVGKDRDRWKEIYGAATLKSTTQVTKAGSRRSHISSLCWNTNK